MGRIKRCLMIRPTFRRYDKRITLITASLFCYRLFKPSQYEQTQQKKNTMEEENKLRMKLILFRRKNHIEPQILMKTEVQKFMHAYEL